MRYPLQHADQAAVARRPSNPEPHVPVSRVNLEEV
ncbi:hypothetical protein BCCR75502_06787 [Burkholderia sola]|nr:hypothetical protein BCCR75389_06754 [Burkholderia cenocepacia]CAG2374915.1 hypothetical protein BCCR12632_06792 [Burkholderia cenocepacia]CAG2374925.1 hypothetical protein BCCR75384_06787 [Burkholderia cenocepacia]CAG2375030.1 hypothetical protein BCCR75386_06787 [Burkholderia cenocepacia]CAG2375033.1 hypothetical protein BCCR75388_06785 [Burkholderia cenocepacia]